jgi:hypothetical protein
MTSASARQSKKRDRYVIVFRSLWFGHNPEQSFSIPILFFWRRVASEFVLKHGYYS